MTDLLRAALPDQPDPELALAARKPWIVDQAKSGLKEARRAPSYATPNLARWFRKNRSLGSRDRRVVSEIIHGVIRNEALLLRAGARSPDDLVARWADLIEGNRFEHLEASTPAEDLATALNVPGPIATEWLETLGDAGAAAFAQSLNRRPAMHIRANALKTNPSRLAEMLSEEGINTEPFHGVGTALTVIGRANLTGTEAFKQGLFEVQDGSSQMFAAALPISTDMRVLDLCAGAGGKSLAMAARGARVTATDIRSKALDELEKRARRAGARIAIEEPTPAPLVIVDAPCSGSGRLRRNPALRWGLVDSTHLAVQAELIEAAMDLVEPDGALAYATCSLLSRENDHAVADGWVVESERTLWPHTDGTDGFFWRILRRS